MIEINMTQIPDVMEDITTTADWEIKRQNYLNLFAEKEYGKRPEIPYQVSWKELVREDVPELEACHLSVELSVKTELGEHAFPVTVFLPNSEEKVPAALLICSQQKDPKPAGLPPMFEGKSPEELMQMGMQMFKQLNISLKNPSFLKEMMSGSKPVPLDLDKDYDNGHWPVREMMKKKMAMIGFYATDAESDHAVAFPEKLGRIFGTSKERKEDEWGLIAVWAFAASCVMDYVSQISEIDKDQIAVLGHSRCGKAALWCGANDERFQMVMPNGSGCCGAAMSRGKTGENLASIQAFFPHWFTPAFRAFAGKEMEQPFDQHCLLSCVAPRMLQVGSGSEDDWADPEGEHLSTVLAGKIWELYGVGGCVSNQMPDPDQMQVNGKVGYHLRKGPHKLDTFDWNCMFEHIEKEK